MTCTHWFVIAPANGPTSLGECKFCGEVRTFRNSDPLETYNNVTRRNRTKALVVAKSSQREWL